VSVAALRWNLIKDKTVGHVFSLRNGKVTRFDIREDH